MHQAMLSLPREQYLYYADVDHVPYGLKTKEQIRGYADGAVGFLVEKGAKAVVVACNTATSVAIAFLRKKYFPIPILGMEPAVKPAVQRNSGKRVMVIATPVTVREKKLKDLLVRFDGDHRVDLLALPRLVTFAEREEFDSKELKNYLRREFSRYDLQNYSALVLGCTHFNFFKDSFHEIFPDGVDLIDGSVGTVNHLKELLEGQGLPENGELHEDYYASGRKIVDGETLGRISRLHSRLDEMLNY